MERTRDVVHVADDEVEMTLNDTTRTVVRNQIIQALRTVQSYKRRIEQIQVEIDRSNQVIKDQESRISDYLDTLEQADPGFNREAYLNRLISEWVV